jgi:signal transduction histidine kinase
VRFAQTIYSAGNDLLHLINDILDISKVEAGKLELRAGRLAAAPHGRGPGPHLRAAGAPEEPGFSLTVEPNVPITIHTDRQRLEQILKNLLSNAVKFTDKGEVSLTVSANRRAGSSSRCGFRHRHRPEQQEKIFDAFHQADGSTAASTAAPAWACRSRAT